MAEYSGPTWATGDKLAAAQVNDIARALEDHGQRIAENKTEVDKRTSLKVGTSSTDAKAGNYVPAWSEVTGKPAIPSAIPAGTRSQLDAGADTTVRAFSAKDIKDFVDARIADLAQPKE